MRYVLIVLLIIIFGYALALVLQNSIELPVDLLFTQVPSMRAGLLLLLSVVLGIIIGLLLGVVVFKVFQRSWEIQRLNREIDVLRQQQIQAASAAAIAAQQEKTIVDVTPAQHKSPL